MNMEKLLSLNIFENILFLSIFILLQVQHVVLPQRVEKQMKGKFR